MMSYAKDHWRGNRVNLESHTNGLEELLASCYLLGNHASHCNHGEAAIVELFGLHCLELLRILGLEAKGVKAQVSWHVVCLDFEQPTEQSSFIRILECLD